MGIEHLICILSIFCRYLIPVNLTLKQFTMQQILALCHFPLELQWLHLVHLWWLNCCNSSLMSMLLY